MSGVSSVRKELQKSPADTASNAVTEASEFFIPMDDTSAVKTESDPLNSDAAEDAEEGSLWMPAGKTSISFIVSLIVHLNIIGLLAAIWIMNEEVEQPVSLISTIAERPGEMDQMDSLLVESLQDEAEEAESQNDLLISKQTTDTSTQLSTMKSFKLGSSQGESKKAFGMKMGTAGFFGAKTEGNSFVFIVDNSGSMTGARFERALAELRQAIYGLKPDQKFYVIFYNSVAVPMPYVRVRKLLRATRKAKRNAHRWINMQKPGGGTVPQQAAIMALKLKPQVIFFLTDGQMPRDIRTTFQIYNKRSIKTIVHTIAFKTRVGEPILKGIALDNKGRYRFID